MARTPGFDRDAVVRAARAKFWESGYEHTAIPDLERSTGLSRSSLYNSFGSKRGLFDAAVQSYLDEVVRPRLRQLSTDPVEPNAVLEYLDGLRAAFSSLDSMPASNGCLLVSSAGAPIGQDPEVARVISEYHAELHGALCRGIRARTPELGAEESDRLGDTVTGLVIAAFALARVDPAQANRSIETARELIEAV